MENSACFIGHRKIDINPDLEKRVYTHIRMMIKGGERNRISLPIRIKIKEAYY